MPNDNKSSEQIKRENSSPYKRDSEPPPPPPNRSSNFWAKYIEKQKQLKSKNPSSSTKNSKSSVNELESESSRKKQFEPIKIKPNQAVHSSLVEKKKDEYNRKLMNTTNLLLLLLLTDKRISGRKHHLTYIVSMKSREDPKKKNYYIVCLLLYQCLLGAFGGVVVGFQTKFLSLNRFPPPNLPIPLGWDLPLTRQTAAGFVKMGSVLWRSSKRAMIAGILFDNIDMKIEQHRNTRDWKNTAIAGGICGSFFGLRGGFAAPFYSAVSFMIIGGIGGYFINKPSDNFYGISTSPELTRQGQAVIGSLITVSLDFVMVVWYTNAN